MAQAPMISIPRKTTDDVDWTNPIRHLIAQSYGENPDNYSTECAALQRCRQDAVRGAGSDTTARDLLYKYFGQLELLELRFSEIRVNFPWHDAFTGKVTTQSSIAFEKASILFQISSTHSSIAASQSRSDSESQKRAFYYFRTCAGMLTYINENFLHAPSTDLSRDVIKFLSGVILAQATEVFYEKSVDEKKSSALVSKIASQTAGMYTSLCEEVKEFMGKGIFDRNWVTLIQIKAKYFTSLMQYHRALADSSSSKHGDALARFTLADNFAKESVKAGTAFASSFLSNLSPTLPPDSGAAMQELLKSHASICATRLADAQRENDLIYNAVPPAPEALPTVDKAVVATPVPIHDVYGTAEVQRTIGGDIFLRLIPLSVHESASVYSEEKAKLVRNEVERCEGAEGEWRSVMEGLGVKEGLSRFRAMAEGEVKGGEEVPPEVRVWKDEVLRFESGNDSVGTKLGELGKLKGTVKKELEIIGRELEIESRDCEELRVKYEHRWTIDPSAGLSKEYRQDLKEHLTALDAAGASDAQVDAMWGAVRGDVGVLLGRGSMRLEQMFREQAGGGAGQHLLDVEADGSAEEKEERARIGGFVAEIESRVGRLNVIGRERGVVLKELKEKVQADDVSHLLLLNRRNTGVEPALFAAELEKFKPYQQQLAANIQQQAAVLGEVSSLWRRLKDHAGRGLGARKWDERERQKKDLVKKFGEVRDVYMEVQDGLAKGLQFYAELAEMTSKLHEDVRSFVAGRKLQREKLCKKLESEDRQKAEKPGPPPPRPPVPPSPDVLATTFSNMNMNIGNQPSPKTSFPPPPSQHSPYGTASAPPFGTYPSTSSSHGTYNSHRQQPSFGDVPYNPAQLEPQPPGNRSFHPTLPTPNTLGSKQSNLHSQRSDPYASLKMLGSANGPPQLPLPPPPTTPAASNGYGGSQHMRQGRTYFPPPPPPPPIPQHHYPGSGTNSFGAQQQQLMEGSGSAYGGFPPPPPTPQQMPGGGYGYGSNGQSGYGR